MIDWDKLGPANSPSPSTTTVPVGPTPTAPPTGGKLFGNIPTTDAASGYQVGRDDPRKAQQAQIDALSPFDKVRHGIEFLGASIFGEGAPLGGMPIVPKAIEAVGDFATTGLSTVGDLTVIKPLQFTGSVLERIPLGWLPGGADENFNTVGTWAEKNDPLVYQEWLAVKAAADADVLMAGNYKADFNTEVTRYLDDQQYNSKIGDAPIELHMGLSGFGSVGGAAKNAIMGFLGLASNKSQRWLGDAGVFDPSGGLVGQNTAISWTYEQAKTLYESNHKQDQERVPPDARYAFEQLAAGKFTEAQARAYFDANVNQARNRVEEAMARLDRGAEVSAVEKQAVEAYRSGVWSLDHAQDFIVQRGQGISSDPLKQIIGTVATDPLTFATVGAGSIAKAGVIGTRVLEASRVTRAAPMAEKLAVAGAQESSYRKIAVAVAAVQQSKQLGPAFRIARGMVDPLSVYRPSASARAVTDLRNGTALAAFDRAYGPVTVRNVRGLAREFGMATEIDSAIASYSIDQANLMIARQAQHDMLVEGFGEDLVYSNVDDVIEPLARNADRDAITKLTDHMLFVAKNTFTVEERADLSGRMAVIFGGDVSYWDKRLAGMSDDMQYALHAITYKRAEVGFTEAMAKVDASAYTGKLPLDNLVLMTSDTLDDVVAQHIIENIRGVLKSEEPEKIAAATAEWNALAMRYPKLANIGYATGGREQVEQLAKELEKELERGAISHRALTDELNDPALRPVRDWLDRNGMPADIRRVDPEAIAAKQYAEDLAKYEAEKSAAEADVKAYKAGWDASSRSKTFDLDAAEVRYEAKGNVDPHNMFSAGWADNAAGRTIGYSSRGYPDLIPPIAPAVTVAPAPEALSAGFRPLWKIGFRPDEEVAWGLRRDFNTGLYKVDRDPTISHVIDAVPGRNRFSDTTRNVLGQVIGKSKAERLNGPIDSIEAMVNTMRDGITGRRLVLNIERRFEKSTFDIGIPKPIAKEIFKTARDAAGLEYTTIRGLRPNNLWKAIEDVVNKLGTDFKMKNGEPLNVHVVLDHLLAAAEGDLRIMGVTSVLSQRMRNAARKIGLDPGNWTGMMTVTMYNKLRYSQPMFLIQRITDAPYYSILYGVTPVGKGALKGMNAETRIIEENLGRTGLARDFSIDMPEFATRSNFTEGIKSAMQEKGLLANKLDRILRAPDTIIANNMTNMLTNRWGEIFRGTLDNLAAAAEKGDPALRADMLAAGEDLNRSVAEWRAIYSEQAGRVLDDNELGLRYAQDQLNAWRRHVVKEDGTLDFSRLIAEGERAMPSFIGEIGPIKPAILAQEMGYADAAALRSDIMGHIEMVNGEYMLVKGSKDLARFAEDLRVNFGAHPDYVRRATAYFGETWDDFWTRLSKGVDHGGLDISSHYAKEAQDLIAMEARSRGMDPWEYLSGVMASNIGAKDLETYMGQLMGFLKAGKAQQPIEEWSRIFRGTLDISAQRTLLEEYAATGAKAPAGVITPARFELVTPKTAPGKAARPPVAKLPSAFKHDPGYVYRVETPQAMEMGLPKGSGVTTGKPTAFYEGKDNIEKGIYRIKDDGSLGKGRHGAGGTDRLTTKGVPPEQIEILAADGTWHPLSADPADTYFATQFPELVRKRILDGVPHPNPDVESYIQQFSKWVNSNIKDELAGQTRTDLRRLVEQVPTTQAAPFNRTHALVVSLLKNKIEDAQADIFRLAEMQTKRSLLERSFNHPLFGLYPASYMWGKVLPETVKFLARNPYAATYVIGQVSRSIAIQREYNPDMEAAMQGVDRSAAAFLLDYLTPSLPWSDHEARMSPLVRGLLQGKSPDELWRGELATVSPDRWVRLVLESMGELKAGLDNNGPAESGLPPSIDNLTGNAPVAPTGGAAPSQISGPTKAAAIAPILAGDLARLHSILIAGESPDQ